MSKYTFKGTWGEPWQLSYISGVCTGVEMPMEDGRLRVVICNSILPETDEEYEKEKDGIIADMSLISASKDLLQACISVEEVMSKEKEHLDEKEKELLKQLKSAIEKALNIKQ